MEQKTAATGQRSVAAALHVEIPSKASGLGGVFAVDPVAFELLVVGRSDGRAFKLAGLPAHDMGGLAAQSSK